MFLGLFSGSLDDVEFRAFICAPRIGGNSVHTSLPGWIDSRRRKSCGGSNVGVFVKSMSYFPQNHSSVVSDASPEQLFLSWDFACSGIVVDS